MYSESTLTIPASWIEDLLRESFGDIPAEEDAVTEIVFVDKDESVYRLENLLQIEVRWSNETEIEL